MLQIEDKNIKDKIFFKDKNVLVAGGTGFIGANLINRLLYIGTNIRATIHRKDPIIIDDRIEYVTCNLLDMGDCKRITEDIDYVFMCAANTSGAAVMASTPLIHVTPNTIMNAQILEASYFAGVKKFVFISSSAAYPPSGDRPIKEEEMFLADPYVTYFGVGWMKRYTEILCRLYSELKPIQSKGITKEYMKTIVIRPSNIYGPYDKFDPSVSHVMAATIKKVVDRDDPIKIWGTGNDVRDFIYIDDFIDGLILATEELEIFQPINIASGRGYNIKNIIRIALDIDNYNDAKIICDSTKPSMIPIMLVDTKKAEKILGFKAKIDIKEGIKKTIDWYRKNI